MGKADKPRYTTSKQTERLPHGYGKVTPLSVYIKERFPEERDARPSDIFIKLTREWKNMKEEEKKKYIDESIKMTNEKRAKYEALTDEEKQKLQEAKELLKEKRMERKFRAERKKRRAELGITKMTGWMLYVKENGTKNVTSSSSFVTQKEVLKNLAKRWKSLSEAEREKYNEKAKETSSQPKEKLGSVAV